MKGCRPLLRDEVRRVLKVKNLSRRDAAMLTVGFSTGYRISELLSLRLGDVCNEQGTIFDNMYVAHTKNGEGRSVRLNTDSKKALKKLVNQRLAQNHALEAPLFGGRTNQFKMAIKRQQAWRVIKRCFELAKVIGGKLATHSLRKTFAARMKEALKGDLQQIQQALGHKSITSTIAYLGVDREKVETAMGELSYE